MREFLHIMRIVFLMPFSLIYGLIIFLRNVAYDYNVFKNNRVNCKVISVGNITLGGTGKTSLVIHLAKFFLGRNKKVVILLRGYKGRLSKEPFIVCDGGNIYGNAYQCGDEAILISKSVQVPVIIGKNRVASAKFAISKFSPDFIILDDGFQYRKLHRDLDIVLISGLDTLLLFPSGALREPLSSLSRASIIFLTKKYSDNLRKKISKRVYGGKMIPLKYYISAWKINNNYFPPDFIKNKKIILFSAIAKFKYFEEEVKDLGAFILYKKSFRDHYYFKRKEIIYIRKLLSKLAADLIVVTEKDAIKIEEINELNERIAVAIQSISDFHYEELDRLL